MVGDLDCRPKLEEAEGDRIFRAEFGRSLAALIRVFADIGLAEDAVQEAFEVALRRWPHDWLPPSPGILLRRIDTIIANGSALALDHIVGNPTPATSSLSTVPG